METPIVHRINFFLTGFTESRAVGTVHLSEYTHYLGASVGFNVGVAFAYI